MTKQGADPMQRQQDLGNVLHNSSLTMRELLGVVSQLEAQILRDVARSKPNQADLNALQSIDLLSQALAEMEALLTRLGQALPSPVSIDAMTVIAPIKLEHLRKLNSGEGDPMKDTGPEQSETKRVMLF